MFDKYLFSMVCLLFEILQKIISIYHDVKCSTGEVQPQLTMEYQGFSRDSCGDTNKCTDMAGKDDFLRDREGNNRKRSNYSNLH